MTNNQDIIKIDLDASFTKVLAERIQDALRTIGPVGNGSVSAAQLITTLLQQSVAIKLSWVGGAA